MTKVESTSLEKKAQSYKKVMRSPIRINQRRPLFFFFFCQDVKVNIIEFESLFFLPIWSRFEFTIKRNRRVGPFPDCVRRISNLWGLSQLWFLSTGFAMRSFGAMLSSSAILINAWCWSHKQFLENSWLCNSQLLWPRRGGAGQTFLIRSWKCLNKLFRISNGLSLPREESFKFPRDGSEALSDKGFHFVFIRTLIVVVQITRVSSSTFARKVKALFVQISMRGGETDFLVAFTIFFIPVVVEKLYFYAVLL